MNTKALLYAVVCAWCPDGKAMTIEFLSRDVPVTHGICDECRAKLDRVLDETRFVRTITPENIAHGLKNRSGRTPKEPNVVSLDDPNVPESLVPKP